jgi:dGTPase
LTPEGEVVSWADRIAYVCHDFEDAVDARIVSPDELPLIVRDRCGERRSHQLGAFITAMIQAAGQTGRVGMLADAAEALAAFRKFNYDNVYLRPASQAQARSVISLLQALVEHYAANPELLPDVSDLGAGSSEALHHAVAYVGGMTDRFACRQAVSLLGWNTARLPQGIDTHL